MALCASQRQHCFPGLAQHPINMVPFTALAHGLHSASPREEEMLVSLSSQCLFRAANGGYFPQKGCQQLIIFSAAGKLVTPVSSFQEEP